MTPQIFVQTFLVDSNGALAGLPSDFYMVPGAQSLEVFDKSAKYCRGKWFACSPDSTGEVLVLFETSGGVVKSGPVLLTAGAVVNINADVVRPVAVRRGGVVNLMYGEGIAPLYFQQPVSRARSNGFDTYITPSNSIGADTNIFCHPNALPSVAIESALFSGMSINVDYATGALPASVTASHWDELTACVFHVNPVTRDVINIRRIYNYLTGTVIRANINAWDRIGLIAIASATNPVPGVPPSGTFRLRGDGHGFHARAVNSRLFGQAPALS